jgi:CMP-N,N'-diacetyllegionaminic acid synthase
MRVLGIIPARGGSKGVPRKNIKLLCGKPLIAYTIEAALKSKRLTRTILSTEDAEIAEVGKALGVDVPFLRPRELAEDATPTLPVVLHALDALKAMGDSYDAICLLQPTSPLRRAEDIDGCIELLEKTGADSVISVLPVPDNYNPKWVYWKSVEGKMILSTGENEPVTRRQDLPPAFHRDGTVYVTKRNVPYDYGNLYGINVRGYEIDSSRSVNIDTVEDWTHAEEQIQKQAVGNSTPAKETHFHERRFVPVNSNPSCVE